MKPDRTANNEQPSIFRGTVNGKAKYCRVLIRRKKQPFDDLKPCPICGELPSVSHVYQYNNTGHEILCRKCGISIEGEDAEALAEFWNKQGQTELVSVLDDRATIREVFIENHAKP